MCAASVASCPTQLPTPHLASVISPVDLFGGTSLPALGVFLERFLQILFFLRRSLPLLESSRRACPLCHATIRPAIKIACPVSEIRPIPSSSARLAVCRGKSMYFSRHPLLTVSTCALKMHVEGGALAHSLIRQNKFTLVQSHNATRSPSHFSSPT